MVGAAIKGLSKILRKGLRKSPVLGKYTKKPRGTPTKAGLVARREALRGVRGIKKQPGKTYESGLKEGMITGALAGAAGTYMAGKSKSAKDARAKEDKKLKKAVEKHKDADKKRKESYGKRAPKKDKYYRGR